MPAVRRREALAGQTGVQRTVGCRFGAISLSADPGLNWAMICNRFAVGQLAAKKTMSVSD